MFGTRNGVQIPWTKKFVLKGADKGQPYISLDYNKLSDADFIKAVGLQELKDLVERSINTAARAHCQDLINERKDYTVDNFTPEEFAKFQDWADGKVEARIPLAEMQKRFWELATKKNTTPEEEQEQMDLFMAIKARKASKA
ncbi:MAG: hypothetical protein EBT61_21375 [Verrucomicrobia bacterium]|nr:hypothetical protein [Verrucomicrobiota bacterium]